MHKQLRVLAFIAALAVAISLLSGCGSGGNATTTPTRLGAIDVNSGTVLLTEVVGGYVAYMGTGGPIRFEQSPLSRGGIDPGEISLQIRDEATGLTADYDAAEIISRHAPWDTAKFHQIGLYRVDLIIGADGGITILGSCRVNIREH